MQRPGGKNHYIDLYNWGRSDGELEERQGQVLKILEWPAEELGCTLLVLALHGLWWQKEEQGLPALLSKVQATPCTLQFFLGLSFPFYEVGVQIPWGQSW